MRLTLKAAIAAMVFVGMNGPAFAADPYGTWTRPSTGAKVEFYDCSGKLCAKVAAVSDDKHKADVGKVIMSGAAKTGDNVWKGDLLNLEDGKTYSGVVTLQSASALELKGCALAGLLCKGEVWTK